MTGSSNAAVLALYVPLKPYELVAAWRPDSRTLRVGLREPVRVGRRVQARISLLGLGVSATILGRAVRASPTPTGGVELELEPDRFRARALARLVDLAAGARIAYRPRAPRLLAEVPAIVYHHRHASRVTTLDVSENGCGLAWSGPMPSVGTPLEIHLGTGDGVASFCGEVCWTAPSAQAPSLGLRFAAGNRVAWTRILADLRRAGAPPA